MTPPTDTAAAAAPDTNAGLDLQQLLRVLTAVKKGDFQQRMPEGLDGIAGKIADTLNDIVELNQTVAGELDRVSTAVGRDGKLRDRAAVANANGGWAGYIGSVNGLIGDLVLPTNEIARVVGAVARGDLTQRMVTEIEGREIKGEFLQTARVVNGMVDQLSVFSSEVTRVAREVGTDGKLGGQAVVLGVAGTWKDLTDSVNSMASNLTVQLRDVSKVATAIARGDLTQKITVDVKGEILEMKDTINGMVDQLNAFAGEVTRVALEVGSEGKLGGQAVVKGVAGTWKDLTDSVNSMGRNLTVQLREFSKVATAIARGDLSQKITVDVRGELLQIKDTINTMVDQLNAFAGEVTRVAREVGTEGKLGGQAGVRGVAGVWKDLTDNVNLMASNLTAQVRNIAEVATAIANGDLTSKIEVDAQGEILELKSTINTMVDQLNAFANEVTRVAREVGTDGQLGGQAVVKGVAGTWEDLTDNVNLMASNLTVQLRDVSKVATAIARGDLSQKITVEVKGEILQIKDTINTMVDQLGSFASEVTRVAREVGTDGKLGGQAMVKGVAGTWKDLTDNVNLMGSNLTTQVRAIAEVATAIAGGDLTRKITVDVQGEILELKNTINTMVDQLGSFAAEVTRVAREVGTEGQLGGQADVKGVAGTWKDLTDNVNLMASNLTAQVRNIAEVATAIAGGDLSKKITVDVQGEILELKDTINTMVDQLNSFAGEVTRVAREVGTEGKLGSQAVVKGVAGTWKDLTDNVNLMGSNLTAQVRNIAEVATAIAGGDLTKKITVDVRGEILELKNTINTMVDQLNAFASEVTRVAREVGTEGKLGGQAVVRGVAGTWKDLTDNVNLMGSNLTAQVRNIADVTTAVARGDLTKKITVDVRGEIAELKNTINTMVDQLGSFASEVTRVAREVGTEGKLGGQAIVRGVAGTWKDLTDNVNLMGSNLTAQVRNIAEVSTAIANGDLSKKITVDVRGEILDLKVTINTMVDQLNAFAGEVTRVAREVGTEGKLGGQATVKGVAGTWKDLTDNVNLMANNLTGQVRNIADVSTAIANGDLSRKITVAVKGEILQLKNTINTMVDQLGSFASEVTRVAREVGTEGKLGGQATVKGVAGTWKDLTDNVNLMASNLTAQVRNVSEVATAIASGDLSRKITVDAKGEILQLKNTINITVDQLNTFANEVTRVARDVGTEGKLGGQATVKGVAGTWKDLTDNVNLMASNLTTQVRAIADVATAIAGGDLSKKITVDVKGEILQLKNTINTMVDQLGSFASEVTRVAREVGTEGKLGGQATVKGVDGTWKDLTDNVNIMASNLTAQVRGIARVVTAVARGDLKRQLTLEAKGEIADLAETINSMIETLGTFGDQVTSVAREVGIEGRLGGQANVPGAAGLWRDLTDNVNRLAGNLTTQVRAIAEVATAVTKGDLTRAITVEASGEVASLKDNINMMIANLRETTRQNTEQDWLKSNLARLTRTLQGQRDPLTVARMMLSELAPLAGAQHAVFYIIDESEHDTGRDGKDGKDGKEPRDADRMYRLLASYAFNERKTLSTRFRAGEGLIGQCALEKQRIMLSNVPQDYIRVTSGLGDATPSCIVVVPVLFEGQVRAVIEMASFTVLNSVQLALLEQVTESLGVMLNTIDATQRTESLLKQSQALTEELRTQQSELTATNQRLQTQARELKQSEDLLRAQQTELESANEQLEERTRLLSSQKAEVERKNTEVEQARQMLEEKARQLALTSRYKSEFLANMSHELRTPLNSLLILSEMLATNADANLSPKEIEFARTIHTSGSDLLEMINDILDLAKIESGKATVDVEDVPFDQIETFVERTFRQVAQKRGLAFRIDIADNLPAAIRTDSKRLQQVLKNLLSNAFKFTEHGSVRLSIHPANDLDVLGEETRSNADAVIAFAVTDTGVGIPADKHRLIFEAFQQADAGTARKFGGTGLGLSITREVVAMLGGQIVLRSEPGEGSTFTVYLPVGWRMPANASSNGGAAVPVAVMHHPHWSVEEDSQTFDDTTDAGPDDRVILIIEDDPDFARLLSDLAHERGFCCLVASTAEEGLNLARTRCPAAITLDIRLPDGDGWVVLDQLKRDRDTAHIPVHVISAVEDLEPGAKRGALAVLQKPVTREALTAAIASLHEAVDDQRRLLVFDDDTTRREEIVELIAGNDVELMIARNETEAISALQKGTCDCVVLGIGRYADAMSVRRIRSHPGLRQVPIVIYANGDTANDDESTEMLGTPVIVDVKSPERLLDEAALFLHSVEANLPAAKRRMLEAARRNDPDLAGKTVLLVDDDTRNIFALSSVLERFGICVLRAGSGREAIETLQNTAGIDAVLMDIMMPEMDGYEAMQVIRGFDEYRKLPIIALTAKAMKGDREKCIEAGATDYLAKPVDVGQLLSLLRVWMHR